MRRRYVCTPSPMILTLVDAVSFAIVVFTAYVAYVIYDKLPPGCSIPMKFDFDGNIVWSAQGSMWIFLYPAISGAILISFVLVSVNMWSRIGSRGLISCKVSHPWTRAGCGVRVGVRYQGLAVVRGGASSVD